MKKPNLRIEEPSAVPLRHVENTGERYKGPHGRPTQMKKPCSDRRCSALDSHGNRCKSTETRIDAYHGDAELYGYIVELSDQNTPAWVFVRLCKRHHYSWEKMKGKRSVI